MQINVFFLSLRNVEVATLDLELILFNFVDVLGLADIAYTLTDRILRLLQFLSPTNLFTPSGSVYYICMPADS